MIALPTMRLVWLRCGGWHWKMQRPWIRGLRPPAVYRLAEVWRA